MYHRRVRAMLDVRRTNLDRRLGTLKERVRAAGRLYLDVTGRAFVRGLASEEWATWRTHDAEFRGAVEETQAFLFMCKETRVGGNPLVMDNLTELSPNRTFLERQDFDRTSRPDFERVPWVQLTLRQLSDGVRKILSESDRSEGSGRRSDHVVKYLRENVLTDPRGVAANEAFLVPILLWLKAEDPPASAGAVSETSRVASMWDTLVRGDACTFSMYELDQFYGRLAQFRRTLGAALEQIQNESAATARHLHVSFFTGTSIAIERYFLRQAHNGFAIRASTNPARLTLMLRMHSMPWTPGSDRRRITNVLDCVNLCVAVPSTLAELDDFLLGRRVCDTLGWETVAQTCVERFTGPKAFGLAVGRVLDVLLGPTRALAPHRSMVERRVLRSASQPFVEVHELSAELGTTEKRERFFNALVALAPVVSLEAVFVGREITLDVHETERPEFSSIQSLEWP